jgi:hypothetical protein
MDWRDREGGLWVSVPPGGPDPETWRNRTLQRQMNAGVAAFTKSYGPHGIHETLMAVYRAMVEAAQPGWKCPTCKNSGRYHGVSGTGLNVVVPCPTCTEK